ncbi:unnamed protein product [Hermetia illucens]|uniref:Uncharacterized protein n=1 Tax=Hermetia illucens TaxID=343691 RepID=A0A7R8Z0B0_HERIL|nr:unnamed protein product [Hermetia illucens]
MTSSDINLDNDNNGSDCSHDDAKDNYCNKKYINNDGNISGSGNNDMMEKIPSVELILNEIYDGNGHENRINIECKGIALQS